MVYVTSTAKTLLTGGIGPGALGDTWYWDGEDWVQVADTGPTQWGAGISSDEDRNVVVLHVAASPQYQVVGGTWEWDDEGWTQIADTGPAPEPGSFSMVYDAMRQVTVLDGGSARSGGVGTWGWDGKEWTQLADTGPSHRQASPLAFDQSRQRVVLFSGWPTNEPADAVLSDTWEWDGTVWKQCADSGPARRSGHAMTGTGDRVLLFGGITPLPSSSYVPVQDTWEWDGKHWKQRQDIGPRPRSQHSMTWDTARHRAVLFAGQNDMDVSLGDTWEAFETP